MSNRNELVNIQNLKYISNICQDLTINSEYVRSYFETIKINNDNLKKIHIDIPQIRIYDFVIIAKNLKILYLLNISNLNEEVLQKIIENCPKLERLFISYCGKIEKQYFDSLKEIRPEIKISYRERQFGL